ncbi:hypothetical protein CHS0354_008115 [Potamilus streckersoni]|uniref:Uncharacterized protein n=1 Tax=Potamilus streckersoni TaxID=2493646 RepID=A0AAE0W4B5_9BIVA|nr:hypothetical protein CHS0354_008115 [Potamilus streckersoni]
MDEGRLGFVHKQENKHRKFNVVMNDVIKSRWETYDEYITKEKLRVDHRFQKSKMLIRRALVRQKVLQRCLKLRQETVNKRHISSNFGKYGGKPLVAFSRDIDAYIADNHPKIRRLRKIRKLIDNSIESGAILDEKRAYEKVQTYFKERLETMGIEPPVTKEKKKEEIEEKKKDYSRYGVPKLPALLNPFMVSQTIQADGKVKEHAQVKEVNILKLTSEMENLDTKFSKQDSDIKIIETTERSPSFYKSKSKGALRLPPIQPTKVLVQTKIAQ